MCKDNWSADSNAEQDDQTSKVPDLAAPQNPCQTPSGQNADNKVLDNAWGTFESKENFINVHFC